MSEELLKLALQEACEREFAEFETGEKHVFSSRHRRQMKKLLRKYYSPPKTDTVIKMPVRKRIIIAICVIILATILCVGVIAIATNGFKFYKQQDHTDVFTVNWENSPKTIDDIYYISALPEGYELTESDIGTAVAISRFKDNYGNILTIIQNVKKDFRTNLNTENYNLEEVIDKEFTGFL